MARVEIFDPAMCCSTGVCGGDVDPALSRFAADVAWLSGRGIEVDRATVSQEPAKFVANDAVRQALEAEGTSALPMVLVNGTVRAKGTYPTRNELAGWAGIDRTAIPLSQVVGTLGSTQDCGGSTGCC